MSYKLKQPKITIITATYNCEKDLKATINSVRAQRYPYIQWIVIDGKSSDSTTHLIKENEDIITNWISEKDNGIYDAWNKSLKFIDGDWVIFMGAGDTFFNNESLIEFWGNAPSDLDNYSLVYGNVMISDFKGDKRYISRKESLNEYEYGRVGLPNHQGVFQPAHLFMEGNQFDSSLKIAGDSKFMIKSLMEGKYYHIDLLVSKMLDTGISNDINNIILANREVNIINKEYDLQIPSYVRLTNFFRIICYLIVYKMFSSDTIYLLKKKFDKIRNALAE